MKIMSLVAVVLIILVSALAVFTFLYTPKGSVTGNVVAPSVEHKPDNLALEFYDGASGCPLNGELFLNNQSAGRVENGILELSYDRYQESVWDNKNLELIGTTNDCFSSGAGLSYRETWRVPGLGERFATNRSVQFEAHLTPRVPNSFEAMQTFIRPEEARPYLPNSVARTLESDTKENLDRIWMSVRLSYISDSSKVKSGEYWRTPAETLSLQQGDCEDWAAATLSLMRAYEPETACYLVIWDTHASVLCIVDKSVTLYDQRRVSLQSTIDNAENEQEKAENKRTLRTLFNNYFDDYGLKANERGVHAAFNEEELVRFNSQNDFLDWIISQTR